MTDQVYLAIRKGVIQTLKAAVLDLTPTPGVYDAVPKNASLPYISIDRILVQPRDAIRARRDDALIYLTIWSDHAGGREVDEIAEAVRPAFDRADISLDSGRVFHSEIRSYAPAPDIAENVYRGEISVRLRIARGQAA